MERKLLEQEQIEETFELSNGYFCVVGRTEMGISADVYKNESYAYKLENIVHMIRGVPCIDEAHIYKREQLQGILESLTEC